MEHNLERWEEVIDGTIFNIDPADFHAHQHVVHRILVHLKQHLVNTPYRVYGSGAGLEIDIDNNFIPDVFIATEDMITDERGVTGTPFLICEVSALETDDRDRSYKKTAYEKLGVQEYWIACGNLQQVEVYRLLNGTYAPAAIYKPGDSFDTICLSKPYTIDVSQLFA